MDQKRYGKLSRAVLDMKFMKKTKERVEQEADDAEGEAMYSNKITNEMRNSGNINFTELSIVDCLNLIEGRLSFRGMNPDIEKLLYNDYQKKLDEAEQQMQKDVSDVEMARGYSSTLVETMGKNFQDKRHRNRNKRKFIKPAQD